jgi:hypothetical protein
MKNKIKNSIDSQMVEAWMGSDATLSDYAEVIAALANGDYEPSECRQEVNDYNDCNE